MQLGNMKNGSGFYESHNQISNIVCVISTTFENKSNATSGPIGGGAGVGVNHHFVFSCVLKIAQEGERVKILQKFQAELFSRSFNQLFFRKLNGFSKIAQKREFGQPSLRWEGTGDRRQYYSFLKYHSIRPGDLGYLT